MTWRSTRSSSARGAELGRRVDDDVASVALIAWRDLPGLFAGRILNGVGLGLMASTATTYLHGLHHEARPERTGSVLPGIVATAANLGGLASGPLVAGAAAERLPTPLITTQAIFTLAMAVCLVLVLSTPETVDLELPAAEPPRRFVLRPGGRGRSARPARWAPSRSSA
ncbi:hypothetical protein [Streptomyces avermitilis]|uniref:hypothetical protein n=1 Tax=Streptomyces avermitilis TaxID=33903 RepID=UPI0033B0521E